MFIGFAGGTLPKLPHTTMANTPDNEGTAMLRLKRTGRAMAMAVLLLVFHLHSDPVVAKSPAEVEVGQVIRDVKMRGLNGLDRRLSDYRGEPLLINVWASWCGPCRLEMGSLERLAWRDDTSKFRIIGISTDDSEAAARAFLKVSNAGAAGRPVFAGRQGRPWHAPLDIPETNWANTIDKPPFQAYAVSCGVTFTFGGVKIAPDTNVQNVGGRNIPGHYAAGKMIGGLFDFNYPSGSGLVAGAVFGRRAGTHAAAYPRGAA